MQTTASPTLSALLACLAAMLLPSLPTHAAEAPRKPNIIFILAGNRLKWPRNNGFGQYDARPCYHAALGEGTEDHTRGRVCSLFPFYYA